MTSRAYVKIGLVAASRGPAAWFASFCERWRLARVRTAQRRALIELPDRLLRDIGLTRSEALREARKPGWKC